MGANRVRLPELGRKNPHSHGNSWSRHGIDRFCWRSWHTEKLIPGLDALGQSAAELAALAGVFLRLPVLRSIAFFMSLGDRSKPLQLSGWTGANENTNQRMSSGASVLIPVPERVHQVVGSLYTPPSADDEATGDAVRVWVRSGSQRSQLAEFAAEHVRWEGLKIAGTDKVAERVKRNQPAAPVGHIPASSNCPSSIPKWCPISWSTVRRTRSRT